MRTSLRDLALVGAMLAGIGGFAAPSQAAINVQPGNNPQPGDFNVINANCTGAQQTPGLTIQGCFNSQPTTLVNFTSEEPIFFPAGGQSRIESVDQNGFTTLTISLASGLAFQSLILNIDANNSNPAGDTVTFTGTPGGSSPAFALGGGQNFFTITGENFSSISFVTTAPVMFIDLVADVQQVRIGPSPVSVPEPASLALFGMGLLGLGLARRARKG